METWLKKSQKYVFKAFPQNIVLAIVLPGFVVIFHLILLLDISSPLRWFYKVGWFHLRKMQLLPGFGSCLRLWSVRWCMSFLVGLHFMKWSGVHMHQGCPGKMTPVKRKKHKECSEHVSRKILSDGQLPFNNSLSELAPLPQEN